MAARRLATCRSWWWLRFSAVVLASLLLMMFTNSSLTHIEFSQAMPQVPVPVPAPAKQVGTEPAVQVVTEPAVRAPAAVNDSCNIFTLWDFPNGAPLFARLNLDTWRRHSHGLCKDPILINDTNVKEYIPDMPAEYWRLPYDAAKSDMIRYALLYHHGGIYMDADFIVVRDLSDLVVRLPQYDLVSYETLGQSCMRLSTFSSNFMGGRKGSKVHGAIWEAQKSALVNHCQVLEMQLEKVCCLDDPLIKCHIPWTQLGEGISHRVLQKLRSGQRRKREPVRLFCFEGPESFVPRNFDVVLLKKPKLQQGLEYWQRLGETGPLDRIAYHLFNSNIGTAQLNREALFDTSTVIGTLYSRSFAAAPPATPSSQQLLQADWQTSALWARVESALQVTVLPEECGGLDGGLGTGATAVGFAWCRAVLEAAATGKGIDAPAGLAYGGSARDAWPRRLAGMHGVKVTVHECQARGARSDATLVASPGSVTVERRDTCLASSAAGDDQGRSFESLSQHLALRGQRGTFVRLDARGAEWQALQGLSDEELRKIDLLDLEAYFCALLPSSVDRLLVLEARVRYLERLAGLFGVVARTLASPARPGHPGVAELCGAPEAEGGRMPAGASISYVNLRRLAEVRAWQSELADRLERATRPSATQDDCFGLDSQASSGDGALHVWCRSVLNRAVGAAAKEGLVGLSYGISTWDSWSKRLSNEYRVHTVLYDCYETAATLGHTPSLEGYSVAHSRKEVCIAGSAHTDGDGRHFETLEAHLAPRGPRGTLAKIDVEGAEWEALQALPDSELQKLDLLDLQFYPCARLNGDLSQAQALRQRVEVLERLARLFHVTARAPGNSHALRGKRDSDICIRGRYPETLSASYVSKARLSEVE